MIKSSKEFPAMSANQQAASPVFDTELDNMLQQAFEQASNIYRDRGFQRRVGFGKKPALINVDSANAWTRPGIPFTCQHIDDQIIPGVQRLLKAFSEHGHPVVHVTTCYQVTD